MEAVAYERVLYKPPTHDLLFPDFSDRISRSRRVGYESGDYEIVSTFISVHICVIFMQFLWTLSSLEKGVEWKRHRSRSTNVWWTKFRSSLRKSMPSRWVESWPVMHIFCLQILLARVFLLLCGPHLPSPAFRLQRRRAAQRNGWPPWSWPSRQPSSSSSWFLPTWTRSWARRHTSTWPTQMELWPGELRRWPDL